MNKARTKAIPWNGCATMTTTDLSDRAKAPVPILAWVLLAGLGAACWLYILGGGGTGMSTLSMTTWQFPPNQNAPLTPLPWSMDHFITMALMWWAMMIAMMLPGSVPHIRRLSIGASFGSQFVFLFTAGYLAAWAVFSLAATGLQFVLETRGLVHPMTMWSLDSQLSACLLALAGMYQFTTTKQNALAACQCNNNRRNSPIKAGLVYGETCLRVSTFLMLLLFVGGVMNLFWVVGLSCLVAVEKNAPSGIPVRPVVGVLCLGLAFFILI